MDTTTVHLSLDGVHLKTVPSRQTTVSLTRLAGGRVTLRLDGELAHVIDDGVLVRAPARAPFRSMRRRLHGMRLAGPGHPAPNRLLRV